jgi:hypothetical protein
LPVSSFRSKIFSCFTMASLARQQRHFVHCYTFVMYLHEIKLGRNFEPGQILCLGTNLSRREFSL